MRSRERQVAPDLGLEITAPAEPLSTSRPGYFARLSLLLSLALGSALDLADLLARARIALSCNGLVLRGRE